jgi:hypothetical protein
MRDGIPPEALDMDLSGPSIFARGTDPLSTLFFNAAAGLRGRGLPGRDGFYVGMRRPPDSAMRAFQTLHGVEFALTYELGPGKNGGGGQYNLVSGTKTGTDFSIGERTILVSHTHPPGRYSQLASSTDQETLTGLRQFGSPQRSSLVIPADGPTLRFDEFVPKRWHK